MQTMSWMLIAVVAGVPIQTEMVFSDLGECLLADEMARQEHVEAYNNWLDWAEEHPNQSRFPSSEAFMQNRIGISNYYTCIPFGVAENIETYELTEEDRALIERWSD